MKIQSNISLKPYNTFGINVFAKHFVEVFSIADLKQLCKMNKSEKLFILGGGSNMLLTQNLNNIVVKIGLIGKEIIREDEDFVWIEVQAGENWHEFVVWCVDRNYGGIENLSLIPGNVGATPIQNIGAYGVEIKDMMESCKALEIDTQEEKNFDNQACHFGYRNSIFKNELKNKYVITSVTFKLSKRNHQIKIDYGAIRSELHQKGIDNPSIRDVSQAVISIRQSKLPDPNEIGNGGSFFKNPIISAEKFKVLHFLYPEMPFYEIDADHYKIPAAWLIETTGFKGTRYGDAGVHDKQALVLVNYGKAKGEQIKKLAETIQKGVENLFKIKIEPEVNIF